jgi:hypothetical protein
MATEDRARRAERIATGVVPPALLFAAHRAGSAPIRKALLRQVREPTQPLADVLKSPALQAFLAQHAIDPKIRAGAHGFNPSRRQLRLPADVLPSSLLHELGHATGGYGGRGIPAGVGRALKRGQRYAPLGQLVAALGSAAAVEAAQTPEDVRRAQRVNAATGIAGSLIGSAYVAEEARAWLRAAKIAKDIGIPLNRRSALLTMGTNLVGPALAAMPAVYTHLRARRRLKELENAQRSVGG